KISVDTVTAPARNRSFPSTAKTTKSQAISIVTKMYLRTDSIGSSAATVITCHHGFRLRTYSLEDQTAATTKNQTYASLSASDDQSTTLGTIDNNTSVQRRPGRPSVTIGRTTSSRKTSASTAP